MLNEVQGVSVHDVCVWWVEGCLHVVQTRKSSSNVLGKYMKYRYTQKYCEGVLFKESVIDICTVSSTDYFTCISLCIGFYILFPLLKKK